LTIAFIIGTIDVFPSEPFDPKHRCRSLDNFILSPHRGGALIQVFFNIGDRVADDLELLMRGFTSRRMQRAERETVAKFCSRPAR
jgi:phosphoglycerate dehydrogenase-like enzyme